MNTTRGRKGIGLNRAGGKEQNVVVVSSRQKS